MAVEEAWSTCRVDESVHRTYRMTALPLLPVPANWLDSLLTDTATTRTVTVRVRADPVEQGGGGGEPGAHLDRVVARGEGPTRVPGHGPGAAPPRRRRSPRAGAGPRPSRVPSRRPGHGHGRVGRRAGRRLRPGRERGRQVADRSASAGRPPGPGLGGVAAAGPVVPLEAAADGPSSRRRPMRPSERARADRRAAEAAAEAARRATRPCRASPDRPSLLLRRTAGRTIPVEWHRSTMAHLCSMYPFQADRGFGEAGIYFGTERHRRPRRVLLRPVRVLQRRSRSRTRT